MSVKFTKVGALTVRNSEAITSVRRKIAGASRLVGFSDVDLGRLAATVSEISRRLLSTEAGATIGIYLKGTKPVEGLALSFPENEAVGKLLQRSHHFDHLSAIEDNGSKLILVVKDLRRRGAVLDDRKFLQIEELLSRPSREELMGELQSTNEELEAHQVNLERNVAERTAELRQSQAQFRLALDNMSGGMLMVDKDLKFLVVNDQYSQLYSLPDGLIAPGKSIEEMFRYQADRGDLGPGDQDQLVGQMVERFQSGQSAHYERHLPNGRTIEIYLAPTPEGGCVAVGRDISQQKELDEKLRKSEETFKAVVDQLPSAIALKDHSGLYTLANRTFHEWFAEQDQSVVGLVTHDLFPKELSDKFVNIDESIRESGETVTKEFTESFVDGSVHTFLMTKFPIQDAEGNVAIGSVETDITERKRAEVELRDARDAAEEATKAKATFLATMSHEIRTPMGGVIGMVDLLQQSKMTDDQQQMINTVGDSAHSLLTIINDILDFSKIEAGKLDLEEISISIRDIVEGAGEALAVSARNKGIGLSVFVDPDIPDALVGDQVRLRQILFNFGTNAIKFTEKGKVFIRADKVASEDKGKATVRFQVIDEGIGIPEEAQKKLFQAFSQVDASTTRKFGGTGLGLTICQRLTEIMNGEIGVESVEGEGSAFSATVSFPIAEEHTFKSDGHDLEGLNVLLVHKDDDMRALIPDYLEHWKATVTATADIDKAKAMALGAAKVGAPFDVICLGSGWPLDEQVDAVRSLQAEKTLSSTGYVVACRGRVRADRPENDNTVYVDAGPLRRAAFIKSVAVAAGRASPEVEHDDSEITLDAGKAPTVAEAEAMGQLILLAEDNVTNQDVIRRQLTMLGYALEIANDGKEALELLETRNFAILLTDCHMPNMDGFELTETIRKSEKDKDIRIPIVAVTASVMKEEVDQCFAAGMDDFIAKPLEMQKAKEMLHKWMPEAEGVAAEASGEAAAEDITDEPEAKDDGDGGNGAINPTALKSVFGDDEATFKEILNDFVEPATSNVGEIEASFNDRSADGVAKAAHKLKSSARSVGANDLAELCQTLELAGKAEDWDEIDKAAPLLPSTIQKVVEYIDNL